MTALQKFGWALRGLLSVLFFSLLFAFLTAVVVAVLSLIYLALGYGNRDDWWGVIYVLAFFVAVPVWAVISGRRLIRSARARDEEIGKYTAWGVYSMVLIVLLPRVISMVAF